jgi:hypothetical protein
MTDQVQLGIFAQQQHGEDSSAEELVATREKRCQRKAVRFSQQVTVYLVEPCVDKALWYQNAEYNAVKCDIRHTVNLIERGVNLHATNEEFVCYRGLEHRTKAGLRRRRQRRGDAYDTVLTQQEVQWITGKNDPWLIALHCMQTTMESKVEALAAASRDASWVLREHKITKKRQDRPARSRHAKAGLCAQRQHHSCKTLRSR